MNSRLKQDALDVLNSTGLAEKFRGLAKPSVDKFVNQLIVMALQDVRDPEPGDQELSLLHNVGPAAAMAAVDYARGKTQADGTRLTTNDVGKLVRGRDGESAAFTHNLREFLLPQYGSAGLDCLVDPRHNIDLECGYPSRITPAMYRMMYDRDDVASRVVDIFPDECWADDPDVYDDDDEGVETPFEAGWKDLCENKQLVQNLYRLDKLCGVGRFGVLLIGLDGDTDLEKPAAGVAKDGSADASRDFPAREVTYFRPFDEYNAYVQQTDNDPGSPRCGLPVLYNLAFTEMSTNPFGTSVSGRVDRKVHWTRVVHVADGLLESLVYGVPRQQQVFNRELDLRKEKGGSAEMLWRGGFPGLAFTISPELAADDLTFDRAEFKEAIRKYSDGLQRYLDFVGIEAKTLNPNVANPEPHIRVQIQGIASAKGIPLRIFMGSEEARLASSQDKLTWNRRLGRRNKRFTTPSLVRASADRLVALRALPAPKDGKYYSDWPDLNANTDEDKANLALKWSQAMSQYVASGMIHLVKPMDFFTVILGLRPRDALRMVKAVNLKKLLKVDPSQGSGVNGKRPNIAGGSKSKGKPGDGKRDSGTKRAEGVKGR